MSFTDDLADVYELGIKECLDADFGMAAFRIDQHYHQGLIIQRIYEDIHRSEVVIAELSEPKANCYYELGFAEALGKPVIRLARVGTPLPFDVNQYQFIFYSNIRELRKHLGSALTGLQFRYRSK